MNLSSGMLVLLRGMCFSSSEDSSICWNSSVTGGKENLLRSSLMIPFAASKDLSALSNSEKHGLQQYYILVPPTMVYSNTISSLMIPFAASKDLSALSNSEKHGLQQYYILVPPAVPAPPANSSSGLMTETKKFTTLLLAADASEFKERC